jgi:hypothetical protein
MAIEKISRTGPTPGSLWVSDDGLTLIQSTMSTCCHDANNRDKESFDPGARKERLPWIWQTPQPHSVPEIPDSPHLTEVDRFILEKLQQQGLTLAARTDDLTWLRRVHFAVTGLPPRREQIQTFSHQGSLLNAVGTPIANILPGEKTQEGQNTKRRMVERLNRLRLSESGGNDALEAAITNAELAARMQVAVPELLETSGETEATQRLYGMDAEFPHTRVYGRQCLIARRMVERGVRFVELTIPMVDGYSRWDAHGGLIKNHGDNARAVDQPIAGLLQDLKQRGLLDSTLVVWAGEFGRTPFAQGGDGRDHNEHGFTVWMAGGGIRPGMSYGATDEWGYRAVEKPLEMHDLHATILHQLGLDHTQLTYRFGGRDFRLTDVKGNVIRDILT